VAWAEFVSSYRRFIAYVLRRMNVADEDVDDLIQQVLIKLSREISTYDRTQSLFRTWLSTIIRNTAINHFNKESRNPSRPSAAETSQVSAHFESPAELDQMIESEWATFIASTALERVRKAFKGRAVEVFELGLEGLSAEAIAQRTGFSVASVYTLRKRVRQQLYIEIRALKEELE
jgi:RNA polymerase sigma-70 factor (ECF subfamily)